MKNKTVKRFVAFLTAVVMTVGCWSVSGVGVTTAQAASLDDYIIADFDFENVSASQTMTGGGAMATGTYSVVDSYEGGGKALHLNANSRQYLSLTKEDGSALFSDIGTGMTISYEAKHDRNDTNWIFFASNTSAEQNFEYEEYVGIMQQNGTLNAERFYNNGSRPGSANTVAGNEWAHVTVVFNSNDTVIYVNGEVKSRQSSAYAIRDILVGDDSICRIGMSTWQLAKLGGEYSTFSLDNFKIYNKALTEAEVAADYAEYSSYADVIALTLPTATTQNLKLPAVGASGLSTITWKSSNPAVIADDGTVTRPTEDTEVTMTATITANGVAVTKTFTVTVLKVREVKPVLEYNFDEDYTAGTAKDSVGNNHAALVSDVEPGASPIYVQDEEYGQVLYLDGGTEVGGIESYLQFPNGFFDGMDSMTISMDVNEVTRRGNYFTFTIGQDNQRYLFLKTDPTHMKLAITTGSYLAESVAETNFVYPNNSRTWINVKMVITANSISLYQDGELIAQNNATGTSITALGTNLKAYLGKSFYGDDKYFRGYFDNVKVYDYAMTAGDVLDVTQQEAEARQMAMSELNFVADKFEIPNADNVKGNITLPSEKNGVSITWKSSNEAVVSTAVTANAGYDATPAGVVTRQAEDTTVTLTATFAKDDETVTKTYDVTVKAAPKAVTEDDYIGYLFVRFTGTEANSSQEQTYFSISKDGLNWSDLNNGQPVLTSILGENGVRDHYIARTAEGDKFYMIATDLSIYHGNVVWAEAGSNGSHSIVVWESEDLVNWSEPWLAEIAPENAGCTWAPEFIYDDVTGEYIVYWSATSIELDENENITQEYENHSIYYAKTRDFRTFTEPVLYRTGGTNANGVRVKVIDSTMIQHNGTYYRYTKNESTGNLVIDKSDTVLGEFTDIASTTLSKTLPNAQGAVEGPIIFKMNERNENGEEQWCLMVDRFARSQGYYPLITTDLESGEFELLGNSEYSFPTKFRHGYVMPITAAEYSALQTKWGSLDTYPLEKAIESAEAIDESLYTKESYNALVAAIADAKSVVAAARTMEEVNAAVAALQAAVDNLVPFEEAAELPYTDVSENAWYYKAVYDNYFAGLMTGKTETLFAPKEALTRAQFALILYRMEGEPDVTSDKNFDDVSAGSWYTDAVLWAYEQGIITGYANTNNFGPHDNIMREQMAVMMYRYAKTKDSNVAADADLSKFGDVNKLGDYAVEAMKWAVGNGIITGKDEVTLDPRGNAIRAEAAVVIHRFAQQ